MKKSELLKLKPGKYLLTDNICNYTYELFKYENTETIICSIKERGTLSISSVSLHYDLIKEHDDEYDRYVPRKRIDSLFSIGGLFVSKNGAYDVYSKIHLVGAYNRETVKNDLFKFSLHHKININKWDKKDFKVLR